MKPWILFTLIFFAGVTLSGPVRTLPVIGPKIPTF